MIRPLLADLDRANQADIAVAFTLGRGVVLIRPHLAELLERGGKVRFLTGDYLDATDPHTLRMLLDWEQIDCRVFEAQTQAFHPKAYIFRLPGGEGVAYVGSSNLTATALEQGIEWNYRITTGEDPKGFEEITAAFETLFRHPATRRLEHAWVDAYAQRRIPPSVHPIEVLPEPLLPPPFPTAVQEEALRALEATRAAGSSAGLIVLGTGMGKTFLAAFDSNRVEYRRIFFVAHREEILAQAMHTFRTVRPDARLGHYTGKEKNCDTAVLFASIQTLGRLPHLRQFAPEAFEYIVVDEFHHACATTYRNLITHFEPKFLLGLTATPEPTDGGDLLALCQENLVYRCDFIEGIRRGLLAPFHYFGVPDEVDYSNIPWRSTRFDDEALTNALATRARARNALEQYRAKAGQCTLAFCCSTRRADFMADYFRKDGIRVAVVHSSPNSDPRAAALERLRDGDLDVIFAVDMFNEGGDVPAVRQAKPGEGGGRCRER